MDDYNQRRLERFTRVQTFGQENAADFKPNGRALTDFAGLGAHIATLNAAKAGQKPARRSKEELRIELLVVEKNIARTARSIDQEEPGFAAAYRLPDDRTERNLLTHADALLSRLEVTEQTPADERAAKLALQAKFVDFEAREDFVDRLRAATNAVRGVTTDNQVESQGGLENTAAIDAEMALANKTFARIDAAVRNRYEDDPIKLAVWDRISRVHTGPRSKDDPAAEPPAGEAGTPPAA